MFIDALRQPLNNQLLFTQKELMEHFSNKLKPFLSALIISVMRVCSMTIAA